MINLHENYTDSFPATTGKNFVQIDHHLNEFTKKEKGFFMKHHVLYITKR